MIVNGQETFNTLILKNLPQNRSDTAFIIGGGSSLKKIIPDPSVIARRDVIATNDAYLIFPEAMLCHFGDEVWFRWHSKDRGFPDNFKGLITTAAQSNLQRQWGAYGRIMCFGRDTTKFTGLSRDPWKVCGSNSGHHAINIAYHLGYKKVLLIGFDMDAAAPETHWHNNHKRSTNTDQYSMSMLPGMKSIAKDIQGKDFKIINLNRNSAIECFEFGDIKDYL
jgi:hypothetical protein